MEVYIVAIIVSLLLMVVLFFALRSTVKRIDHNTKKFFLDKLQDYDYLIDEKQKVLDELNNEITKKNCELESLKTKKVTSKEKNSNKYYQYKIPKYSDENIFEKYKTIKQKFTINCKDVVEKFIKNNLTEDNSNYDIALQIKNKFTNDAIYKILNLRTSQQKEEILSLLTNEQREFFSKNFVIDKFEIKKIVIELDNFLEKNDPKIYVYVGNCHENFNMNSDKVEIIVDSSINEGIKIRYKGNLYDYSL